MAKGVYRSVGQKGTVGLKYRVRQFTIKYAKEKAKKKKKKEGKNYYRLKHL